MREREEEKMVVEEVEENVEEEVEEEVEEVEEEVEEGVEEIDFPKADESLGFFLEFNWSMPDEVLSERAAENGEPTGDLGMLCSFTKSESANCLLSLFLVGKLKENS